MDCCVYTYYDASPDAPDGQAERFRAWATSWEKQGWEPRILTARKAKQSKLYAEVLSRVPGKAALPYLAFHAVGGGWFAPMNATNGLFKPIRRAARLLVWPVEGLIWSRSSAGVADLLKAFGTPGYDKVWWGEDGTSRLLDDPLGHSRARLVATLQQPNPWLSLLEGGRFAG